MTVKSGKSGVLSIVAGVAERGWLIATVGVLAATLGASSARAIDKSWNTAVSDPWSNAALWTPAGVPEAGDVVRLGDLPWVTGHTVFLNQNATIAGLHITNDMALQTEGRTMIVTGDTTLNDNARLNIENAIDGVDYATDDMVISADSNVWLTDSTVRINDHLLVNGEIRGIFNDVTTVQLWDAGTTLTNNGLIGAGTGSITYVQINDGEFDLDGQTGDGELLISGVDVATLTFTAGGLTDAFSGLITLGPYARLNMYVGPWVADASSFIDLFGQLGNQGPDEQAVISGDHVTLAGGIDVSGWTAKLTVAANATLAPTANVAIGEDDRFVLEGETLVQGGTFDTNGMGDNGGQVNFDGPTEWAGTVTIDGRGQQNGEATVTAPTVINAGLFDFSGEDNQTTWNIQAPLVINAVTTKTEPYDFFEGELNIGGGFLGRLTFNLDGGTQSGWGMNGVMNLSGNPVLFVNRVDGAYFVMDGEMNIDASKVEIGAGVYFWPGSSLNFASAASQLRMRGETHLREGMEITGAGTLINGLGGEMCIHHAVALDDAGLENHGLLEFRRDFELDLSALVAVDRFVNDDDGTMRVRVGGYVLGEGYDHLLVTGGMASLDGLLDVLMFDADGAPFAPQVGDVFPIITALGGVVGMFDGNPVSQFGGKTYHWVVDYFPNQASLRLAEIVVPEPTGAVLVALAVAGVAVVRRRLAVATTASVA